MKTLKNQIGSAVVGLIGFAAIVAVAVGAVYGYVENILKLLALDGHVNEHILQVVIRIIGVLTATGAIMGYC